MKNLFLLLIFLSQIGVLAQEKFQYAIVPVKFDFQKSENQYNINATSKKMLESFGLTTYFDNEVPENLDLCEALVLNIKENNSMLATKITLEFKDCKNKVLFESEEGRSREKDFKKSYNEALRNAAISLKDKGFLNKNSNRKNTIVEDKKTEKETDNEVKIPKKETEVIKTNEQTSYKLIENTTGYELIDNKKEVIALLYKTSNPSIFIVKDKNYQGIAYLTFNSCTIEYYRETILKKEIFVLN